MTQNEETMLLLRGLIASLPEEQQQNVQQCLNVIRNLLTEYPAGEATVAVGLCFVEMKQLAD